jgi:hypothetical protein
MEFPFMSPMKLPPISAAQLKVVELLKEHNVIVDSVAGSGKTTCNLHIAKCNEDKRILLLTYNSKLKIETRERVEAQGIDNLEVHSYHSFCVKYFDPKCITDSPMRAMLDRHQIPIPYEFDMLVLDEAQDITPMFYELIGTIYRHNHKPIPICIFGDKMQSIFEFNGADARYMEFAATMFAFNDRPWVSCTLPTSFRITTPMATFLNESMLKHSRVSAVKPSNFKPDYIVCDMYGDTPYQILNKYLSMYKPDDIFILAPSVISPKNPIRALENRVKRDLNVLVFVPSNDDEALDENVLRNKLVFSTFHQSKGLERKVVLLFGFDNSYFMHIKKDADPNVCPNELYVAVTRACERLSIFHSETQDYLPFLKTNLNTTCRVWGPPPCPKPSFSNSPISVTNFIRHLPFHIIEDCMRLLTIVRTPSSCKLDIPVLIQTSETTSESVAELNGLVIPTMFEITQTSFHQCTMYTSLMTNRAQIKLPPLLHGKLKRILDQSTISTPDLLFLANCWNAYKDNVLFKVCQIEHYNWITPDMITTGVQRIQSLSIHNAMFEVRADVQFQDKKISGYMDCVTSDTVYEFKCVQQVKDEHLLQLAIYMFMRESTSQTMSAYVLYNILTNERVEIKCSLSKLNSMMAIIYTYKYGSKCSLSTQEFLRQSHILL